MTKEEALRILDTIPTKGDEVDALEMAIEALEREVDVSTDTISRQAAIGIFTQLWDCIGTIMDRDEWEDVCKTTANELPSAQRKGKWLEKKVVPVYENGLTLQSCRCSECGRYDTRPYMHYFSEPNFCSYCGAEMTKGDQDG